jgi:hypothetical protein
MKKAFMSTVAGDTVANYVKDIFITWPIILSSFATAFVIAVLYLVCL